MMRNCVGDVISKDFFSVDTDSSIKDAAKLMVEKKISSLAVAHSGKLMGILTDSDFVKMMAMDNNPSVVGDIMTPNPITVDSDRLISKAAKLMSKHKVRHLIVLELGEPIGVISLRDILKVEPETCYTYLATILPV